MPTRNINLTDHFDGFIDKKLTSGQYKNASEVVRAGLRLLEQADSENAARLAELKQAVRLGENDFEAGRVISLKDETELKGFLAKKLSKLQQD